VAAAAVAASGSDPGFHSMHYYSRLPPSAVVSVSSSSSSRDFSRHFVWGVQASRKADRQTGMVTQKDCLSVSIPNLTISAAWVAACCSSPNQSTWRRRRRRRIESYLREEMRERKTIVSRRYEA
jgi:hypothetical protein